MVGSIRYRVLDPARDAGQEQVASRHVRFANWWDPLRFSRVRSLVLLPSCSFSFL